MKENRKKMFLVWVLLSFLVVLGDQISKQLVITHLAFAEPFRIFSFLNFNLNYNSGAAFSFLAKANGWQNSAFILISLLVCLGLLIALYNLRNKSTKISLFALSLILGGAIGNLIDRIRLSYVIDFISFHIKGWHFAIFNFADSAICIGTGLLILSWLIE